MNKHDRRVKKTIKALQSALADAMLDKELQKITVQELVNKADIHTVLVFCSLVRNSVVLAVYLLFPLRT
jgi:ribosome-binding factor A